MSVEIREERPDDIAAIRYVHTHAFGQTQEADIVDALRANSAVLLALVAVVDGRVVGHILYSPASVDRLTGAALGPVSILPEYQRRGLGSALIESGNRKIQQAGHPFIIVIGHADYYPRFGFRRASTRGISCEWDVPDNAFMVLDLDESRMRNASGVARYRQEFSTVS
jgi:putative acetyltransferase